VDISSGYLNIRSRPVLGAPVVARACDGARLDVINEYEGWYLVGFGSVMGYVSGDFVTLV
jgi:N-acetylmuramoyl-L-alanine amidase